MGDDDELGAGRVPAQQLQETIEVHVIERGLDLVEDVERARPGQEYGEHEGERHQRLLAPGHQRQPARGLARGRQLDLDAELVLFLALALALIPVRLRLGCALAVLG